MSATVPETDRLANEADFFYSLRVVVVNGMKILRRSNLVKNNVGSFNNLDWSETYDSLEQDLPRPRKPDKGESK